ncbi:MAG: hypothetical protein A2X18_02025 [Bacteroidetes bacterium GWF2_40_14]|nr:MAG: hypothetical protein A2X18_02025 [Bacteroidetes bacterium GWF2_40_14]
MILLQMNADTKKFAKKTNDDLCCCPLADNIIHYIFDLEDNSNNISPAVAKTCKDMPGNEMEAISQLLDKFYDNLNENRS